MENQHDDDVCPLDVAGPRTPPRQGSETVPAPVDIADARLGSQDSAAQDSASSPSHSSSRAASTTSHGPFGDSQADSSAAGSEQDASSTHRRPSVWTTIPTADQPRAAITFTEPVNEKSSAPVDKSKRISWRVEPFVPGEHPGHLSHLNPRQGSRARSRTGSIAVAAGAIRRVSHVVLDPINPLREIGNPLDLQINEVRRISSVAFPRRDDFDGRKQPSIGQLPRKPSLFPTDIPEVEDEVQRADDDPEDFIIQRLAAHDDIDHMPRWKRYTYMTSPFWGVLTLASYFAYLSMRIKSTVDAQRADNTIFGLAWTFIAVEFGVAIPMIMHRTWSMLMVRGRRRPKLRLLGNEVPSVDVIITCCGEDDDLTFNTALAACNIDYPADRFRVMILDDGASAGLKALVEDPKKHTFTNMYYFSRPKYPGVPHHFKAGNLNYALEQTKLMKGGAANFMAALDADMIPTKDWLRGLLPHMLQDTKCSMACPPQQFYNVPVDDPLCQSLDTFIHISEPIKDALGVAWCTGSGYVMRRDALDSIGNFPLGSLAEDVCTSSMLLGAGWNTVFVHEPLQFGTVPDSLTGHLKQRTRWTIGTVQTSPKLKFCLYGPLVKHMSVMQKASGFVYTVSSLFTIFLVLSLFTVPVVLYEGGTMVPYATKDQLVLLVRLNFITMVANRINEWVTYLPSGYFVGQRDARGMLWMAPYHAMSVIQSFLLPKWLGGKIAVFTSSGSQSSALNERDKKLRAPLLRRLKVTLIDCKAWLHLTYIFFVLGSVALSCYRVAASQKNKYPDPTKHKSSTYSYLLDVLTHAGWPPVLWLVCLVSCWTPVQYAIAPPSVPDVDVLLEREERKDGGLGPAYPTKEAIKIKQSKVHILHEVQYTLLCAYQAAVFAWSFYF